MALLDNTVLIYRFLIRSLGSKWDPCVFNDPLSGAALFFFFVCIFSFFSPLDSNQHHATAGPIWVG